MRMKYKLTAVATATLPPVKKTGDAFERKRREREQRLLAINAVFDAASAGAAGKARAGRILQQHPETKQVLSDHLARMLSDIPH